MAASLADTSPLQQVRATASSSSGLRVSITGCRLTGPASLRASSSSPLPRYFRNGLKFVTICCPSVPRQRRHMAAMNPQTAAGVSSSAHEAPSDSA